jgi:hypothetical protein
VKLPPGATGFWRGERAGSSGSRAFLSACHDAARRTGGTITAIERAGVTRNFDAVLLAYEHERLAVLRHMLLDLVTFAEATGDHVTLPLAFAEPPRLVQIFRESGFRVLSAVELSRPLASSDLSELTAVEHEQIRYWKPATAGEILFNYWD